MSYEQSSSKQLPFDMASVRSTSTTASTRARRAADLRMVDFEKKRKQTELQQIIRRQELEEQLRLNEEEAEVKKLYIKADQMSQSGESEIGDDLISFQEPVLSQQSPLNLVKQPFSTQTDMPKELRKDTDENQFTNSSNMEPILGFIQSMATSIRQGFSLPKKVINKFDGSPLKFHDFLREFNTHIGNEALDTASKLSYLIDFCVGEARIAIEPCGRMEPEQGFRLANDILHRRFGVEHKVTAAHIRKLTDGPSIKANDLPALEGLLAQATSSLITLTEWNSRSSLDNVDTIKKVVNRFPAYMAQEFARRANKTFMRLNEPITFDLLIDYLEEVTSLYRSDLGESVFRKMPEKQRPSTSKTKGSTFSTFAAVNNRQREPIRSCVVCNGIHPLWRCTLFRTKDVESRREIAKKNKVCFRCLQTDHMAKVCKSNFICRKPGCGKSHNTLLHVGQSASTTDTATSTDASVSACVATMSTSMKVRLQVVPVKVWGKELVPCYTYAFIDGGSDISLCARSLADQLHLDGEDSNLDVATLNGTRNVKGSLVSLSVQGILEPHSISVDNAVVVDSLPDLTRNIPTSKDVKNYSHLRNLRFPAMDSNKVELLIGADILQAHICSGRRHGKRGQPSAIRTGLGWALFGPEDGTSEVMTRQVNLLQTESNRLLHLQLERTYNHDFNDKESNSTSLSIEDKRALQIMKKTTKLSNGHYQMDLPWKSSTINLPFNRFMAEKRLHTLKRKFFQDPKLFKCYSNQMNDYIENGYATKVPVSNLTPSNKTWYIPHHSTGGKFRIVFDCAAKFKGTCLNDHLLQGPDHANSLVGVLLRFREDRVAFVSDVKAMFHQVKVSPHDRDSLRFLWWPNNNLSLPPQDYQMTVHLFGATSSPSCAGYALRRCANDNIHKASKDAVTTIKTNFYVDDCLKSVPSAEKAISLIKEVSNLLKTGGFHLTKFVSNSKEVLSSIPDCDRSTSTLDLDFDVLPIEKTLGLCWDMNEDNFRFKVHIVEKPSTRRGILSMVSQVYDPLGFIQPFMLPMKILMQKLCNLNLGWDEILSDHIIDHWNNWKDQLPTLEAVSIPRCYKMNDPDSVNVQLHCFCDASESGYGAVSYLRSVYTNGTTHCSFVMGKSRVTPVKPVTIPRLELTAAVVAVKLNHLIQSELDLKIDDVIYWSDSTSVLQYIANKTKRFHTFVANRLAVIHELSAVDQWRYISSKNNPADIGSRGLMPNDIKRADLWFRGPSFLCDEESQWPQLQHVATLPIDDPEVRKEKVTFSILASRSSVSTVLHRYSSFRRLQKTIGWLLRYKMYFTKKYLRHEHLSFPTNRLSLHELEEATSEIVKLVQKETFSKELKALPECNDLQRYVGHETDLKRSPLRRLNPVKVNGILLVGGRIQRSTLLDNRSHPMILPYKHHVTDLIIDEFHQQQVHSGTLFVLSFIREKLWIVKGHSAVRQRIRRCFNCKLRNAKTGEQIMAPLPPARVTSGKPPFTYVGVDYMGPFLVKLGRSQPKRYGCVFTCMATRAIHIEVAYSLDTSSFIQAFRRFIDRRGPVQEMFSDNGTNFVGAERELKAGIERWNQTRIHETLTQKSVQWHFNPPSASHQGGVWERMIRSIRRILRAQIGEKLLDDEGLHTFLVEVEQILNNRPITAVSDDPRDFNTLSPSMILHGKLDDSLPPDEFVKADGYRRSWRTVQLMLDQFWSRWLKEYLPILQTRQKWFTRQRNFAVGDLVLLADERTPRGDWPKAIVEEVFPDRDGVVRRASVRTSKTTFLRDIRKLCLLEASE